MQPNPFESEFQKMRDLIRELDDDDLALTYIESALKTETLSLDEEMSINEHLLAGNPLTEAQKKRMSEGYLFIAVTKAAEFRQLGVSIGSLIEAAEKAVSEALPEFRPKRVSESFYSDCNDIAESAIVEALLNSGFEQVPPEELTRLAKPTGDAIEDAKNQDELKRLLALLNVIERGFVSQACGLSGNAPKSLKEIARARGSDVTSLVESYLTKALRKILRRKKVGT